MQIMHETLWEVFNTVNRELESRQIISSHFDDYMMTGGINYGQSWRESFEIDSIKGRGSRKCIQMIVFRCGSSGRYELVLYVN